MSDYKYGDSNKSHAIYPAAATTTLKRGEDWDVTCSSAMQRMGLIVAL